jgi:hypothetical protein
MNRIIMLSDNHTKELQKKMIHTIIIKQKELDEKKKREKKKVHKKG